ISENILTSLNLKEACGVNKNRRVGNKNTMPIIIASKVCLLCCHIFLKKMRERKITNNGLTIRAVLKTYMDKTKDAADRVSIHGRFCIANKNSHTPQTIKNVATFASNAARESIVCHGEIAKIPDATRAIHSLF